MHVTHLTHVYTWAGLDLFMHVVWVTCDGRRSCSWGQHGNKPTGTSFHEEKPDFGVSDDQVRPGKQPERLPCPASYAFLLQRKFSFYLCLFHIREKERSLMTHFSLQGHWTCPPEGRCFASSSSAYVQISNCNTLKNLTLSGLKLQFSTHIHKYTHTHSALSLSPAPVALETAEMGTPSLPTPSQLCDWLRKVRELHRHLAAKTEEGWTSLDRILPGNTICWLGPVEEPSFECLMRFIIHRWDQDEIRASAFSWASLSCSGGSVAEITEINQPPVHAL